MSDALEDRLHGLDHLRAAAILMVMLLHYAISYGLPYPLSAAGIRQFVWFGWTGVDLFFVLSGYLIGGRLLAEVDRTGGIRLSRFWIGRGLRILPAYLVVVAVYFAAGQVREPDGLAPLWKFLTFTQNLQLDPRAGSFVHAWSLCVEWHFYLLLPLGLLLVRPLHRRSAGWVLLGIAGVGLIVRHVAWVAWVDPLAGREREDAMLTYLYSPTYTRWDGLLVGVAIAALFRYLPEFRDRLAARGNALLVVGLLALGLCCVMYGGRFGLRASMSWAVSVWGFSLVAIAYGMVVAAALCPGTVLHRWRSRVSETLAAWSFAIYLVHVMAFRAVHTALVPQLGMTPLQGFLASVVTAILAGALLHHVVERPFLALRGRLYRRDEAPVAVGGA